MVNHRSILVLGAALAATVVSANPLPAEKREEGTAAVGPEGTATTGTAAVGPGGGASATTTASEVTPAPTTTDAIPPAPTTPAASTSASGTSEEPPAPTPTTDFARPWTNNWVLDSQYQGESWYEDWDWETYDDPTRGRVNYVDQGYARENGLVWTNGTVFGMSADTSKVVAPDARGRDSVRIVTQKSWLDFVVVLDLTHMPVGCGTWPAFWTLGDGKEWPNAGEIDIIEGTNEDTSNLMTLHTEVAAHCAVPANRSDVPEWKFEGGTEVLTMCGGNTGCNVRSQSPETYGAGLNAAGGGFYVTRRDVRGVSFWFYPRSSGAIPETLLNPSDTLDETALGIKIADLPNTSACPGYDSLVLAQRLIINLTFCGSWAGPRFDNGACFKKLQQKCVDYVDQNPDAFRDAYWLINDLRVYTPAPAAQ